MMGWKPPMFVELELEQGFKFAVNPRHVVSVGDETSNQSGRRFCRMTLCTGKTVTVMASIEKTTQLLCPEPTP